MIFEKLQLIINYKFRNVDILREALTHPSFSKENNYERFEFFGDSILNYVISKTLYNKYKYLNEGGLAKKRSYLVKADTIVEIARKINLGEYLILSDSEKQSNGKDRKSSLENAFEALIAAINFDAGISEAEKFILKMYEPFFKNLDKVKIFSYKTSLQEFSAKKKYGLPEYLVEEVSGYDHNPRFKVSVRVGNFGKEFAEESSKKRAENIAAEKLYKRIVKDE